MNPKPSVWAAISATLLLCTVAHAARADDSAASIAAGGLVSRRETRVVMAKEVLRISPGKVIVDYDFRNDTDHDITTEVAFPMPPYRDGVEEPLVPAASFSTFKLEIDGKPARFEVETKAFLDGKDVSSLLAKNHIDIATFGHYDWGKDKPVDFAKLSKDAQSRLIKEGLIDPEMPWGNWTVHLQYHWTQTFPAHSTVHIRHEYAPVEGYQLIPRDAFRQALHQPAPSNIDKDQVADKQDVQFLQGFCPGSNLLRELSREVALQGEADTYAHVHWVDFILTSANTWRRPIEDFTMIVERGRPEVTGQPAAISFCSPGPVVRNGPGNFQVHLKDFVPTSELHIGFFETSKK